METKKRATRKPRVVKPQENNDFPNITQKAEVKQETPIKKEVPIKQEKPLAHPTRRRRLHTVFVKGQARQITESAFNAVVKDPRLNVELPPNSALKIPDPLPCKDC